MTDAFLYTLGGLLILVGAVGAIVPALPGIPLMFGGMWIIAAVDRYRHLGLWWLLGIAAVGGLGIALDLLGSALGAQRVGASRRAVWGALIGTAVGLFFGLPGLLLGPFLGAMIGELSAGQGARRATRVGAGAWLGLVLGTVIKLVASVTMLVLFGVGWWWNRGA